MMRPLMILLLICAGLPAVNAPASAQSNSRAIACATTDILSEKAMCAWEDYRDNATWIARSISRTLIMLDGMQGAMDPGNPTLARDLFVDSQEAWADYREATCKLEAHLYFGGRRDRTGIFKMLAPPQYRAHPRSENSIAGRLIRPFWYD